MKTNAFAVSISFLLFCLPCPAQAAQLNIHPAVELSWLTESGKVYQVYASEDLHNWHAIDPAFEGNDDCKSFFLRSVGLAQYFRLSISNPAASLLVADSFEGAGSGGFSPCATSARQVVDI